MLRPILKYFAGAGIFIYVAFVSFVVYVYLTNPYYLNQTDLMCFLTGAKIIREGRVDKLYDTQTQLEYENKIVFPAVRDKLLPFRSIPFLALAYIPLTYLTLKKATLLVVLINALLMFAFLQIVKKYLFSNKTAKTLPLIMFLFWPSLAIILAGQHLGLILIVYVLAYIFLLKRKDTLTGIVSALLLLKPNNILFIPFLIVLVKDKKKFLTGFLISVFIFGVLNLAISNLKVLLSYPGFVLSLEQPEYGNRPGSIVSVFFLIKQLFPAMPTTEAIIVNFLIYALFLFFFIKRHKNYSDEIKYIISILAISILSMHSLSHDLIIFMIPISILLSYSKRGSFENTIILLLFITPILVLFINAAVATVFILIILTTVIIHYDKKAVKTLKSLSFGKYIGRI